MIYKVILTMLVGTFGGFLAKKIKLPAPFMTGSMLAVAVFSVISGQMYAPTNTKLFAQIVSGAFIGQQVTKSDLKNFPSLIKPIALLMLFFTINTFVMGFVFSHFYGMDAVTALLSCLPGGIMDVSLISIDMGADSGVVAVMQLARLVGMLLILPYWTKFIINKFGSQAEKKNSNIEEIKEEEEILDQESDQESTDDKSSVFSNNVLVLIVSTIGGLIGKWIGIPVGALIFSLIFSLVLKVTKDTKPLSNWIRYIAQISAGSIIGCSFTRENMEQLSKLIIPVILLLISYLVVNVVFARIIYKRGILDLQSALFASSPAGATDISLIAGELGGDMPKIAGIQISRTLYIVIVLPYLVRIFSGFLE